MRRITEWNFKINEKKCEYRKESVEFLGFVVSKDGIEISTKKVQAIRNFRRPAEIEEVRSFLGLVTFVSHFIDDFSTKTEPLRQILKASSFKWTENQQKAFDNLRLEIEKCTLKLGCFSPEQETFLYTDASGVGIGAVLAQRGDDKARVITCIARSLTKTEAAYSQVQREALAISWAVRKLSFYLIGAKFKILTDNRSLKFIFGDNKHLGKRACNRADAFALELQSYNYEVHHIPGKQNIADILSRLTTTIENDSYEISVIIDEEIDNIMEEDYFAITHKRIKLAITEDETLNQVMHALKSESWSKELSVFQAFKESLYEIDGILWRDERIVLPQSLRQTALEIAHRGHSGSVSMKRALRERVWWPSMDIDIKDYCKKCLGCTCVERTDPPEPLKMTVMPNEPWEYIAIDFFLKLPNLMLLCW